MQLTAFSLELPAHVVASLVGQVLVPRSADMNRRGKRADEIRSPNAISSIMETHPRPPQTRHGACRSRARVVCLHAHGDVDLLLYRHLADQSSRIGVRLCPDAFALAMSFLSMVSMLLAFHKELDSRLGKTGGDVK